MNVSRPNEVCQETSHKPPTIALAEAIKANRYTRAPQLTSEELSVFFKDPEGNILEIYADM